MKGWEDEGWRLGDGWQGKGGEGGMMDRWEEEGVDGVLGFINFWIEGGEL